MHSNFFFIFLEHNNKFQQWYKRDFTAIQPLTFCPLGTEPTASPAATKLRRDRLKPRGGQYNYNEH